MSSVELLDELEAGELVGRVRGRGAAGRCSSGRSSASRRGIALSTAFQVDGVALLDMAYEIDPDVRVFTVDTGRLPAGDVRADRAAARPLPGLELELLVARRARRSQRWSRKHGPNLFYESVELRLLCCNVRKVRPLTQHLARARRLDHRPAPRPVGEPHEHPQGRDRPRPRRDRQAQPARRVDRGGGLGLRRASTTSRTTRSTTRATPRSAARRARARSRPGEDARAGRWWWETNAPKECGIHCAVETGGFEHELHAILGEDDGMSERGRARSGEAARGRARRGAGGARDGAGRGPARPARRRSIAAIDEGEVGGDDADALERAARARAPDRPRPRALRPGRRAGGAARSTAGCRAGRELAASAARGDRGARRRSRARARRRSSCARSGPARSRSRSRGGRRRAVASASTGRARALASVGV